MAFTAALPPMDEEAFQSQKDSKFLALQEIAKTSHIYARHRFPGME